MSNKKLIMIRVTKDEVLNELREFILQDLNYNNRITKNEIITKNIIIKLITIPIGANHMKKVMGMRADGCFGFDKEAEDYLTRGHNDCSGRKLLDYIKEIY